MDSKADKKVNICSLPSSSYNLKEEKEEWIKDILFFRDNCHEPLRSDEEDPILPIKKRELEEYQRDLKIKSDVGNNKLKKLSDNLQDVQSMALNVRLLFYFINFIFL